MSDIKTEGFKSSDVLAELASVFSSFSETEKKAQIKKANGIFELQIKNSDGKEGVWTIDLKNTGTVFKGSVPKPKKADVIIILSDETFCQLADNKLDGQRAFMTGKLKTKGNMMLATKLDSVLKAAKPKAKL